MKAIHEKVKGIGNEQATKSSLIGPLFTLLGYDLADPEECIPEYKADFGKDRSVKPVDWAFYQNGRPIFLVEAKDAGKKLGGYDEQLGDYFAKVPDVKLGILTNGVVWRFFTDIINANVMDKEPFVKWDVLNDEQPPYDFLTLLQKSQFKTELVRTLARRQHEHNLLVNELDRLLEPAAEFTRLAIANIETRNLTASVVESWKPVVASAVVEWAKQRRLASVLTHSPSQVETQTPGEPEGEAPSGMTYVRSFGRDCSTVPKPRPARHANVSASDSGWISAGSGVRGFHSHTLSGKKRAGSSCTSTVALERPQKTKRYSKGCTNTGRKSRKPSAASCRGSGSTTSTGAGSPTSPKLAATKATSRSGRKSRTP